MNNRSKTIYTMFYQPFLAAGVLLCLLCFTVVSTAHAACVAGLPCIVDATPNDPLDPDDGPNADGMPNEPKRNSNNVCDADFMNQIYANAFLHAERETMLSNVLVKKPDSVLEYSCFDQHAAVTARDLGALFSDRLYSATVPFSRGGDSASLTVHQGDTHLDTSIETLTLSAITTYINSNFSHPFLLGGTGALDTNFSSTVAGVGAVCDMIFSVHDIAKCSDFADEAPFNITRFSALAGGVDLRARPQACTNLHGITNELLALANNDNFQFVNFDPVVTYLDNVLFRDCAIDTPLPTGRMLTLETYSTDFWGNSNLTGTTTYEDKVCSNPSCYYNPGGNNCQPSP